MAKTELFDQEGVITKQISHVLRARERSDWISLRIVEVISQ